MKKIECGDGHGTDDFNCYGYGTINENKEKVMVNLGKTPGVSSFSKENYADLSSDTIMVFYRPDFKQTILKKENEQKLDKNRYLRKGLMELIYPILVYPLIVFYFRKTNRKLKQLENE
ncbi:hypothetical protein [Tenacibaculum sp. C7A-26P2]|uniref:hypothetical protein n=1 Tax=Tenacibaculum sp. C7A-26P2 TaxID=3447504 RepID=UPI003F8566AC